jgi:hypothetical protein
LQTSSHITIVDLSLQREPSASEEYTFWLSAMIALRVAFEKPAVAAGFMR